MWDLLSLIFSPRYLALRANNLYFLILLFLFLFLFIVIILRGISLMSGSFIWGRERSKLFLAKRQFLLWFTLSTSFYIIKWLLDKFKIAIDAFVGNFIELLFHCFKVIDIHFRLVNSNFILIMLFFSRIAFS